MKTKHKPKPKAREATQHRPSVSLAIRSTLRCTQRESLMDVAFRPSSRTKRTPGIRGLVLARQPKHKPIAPKRVGDSVNKVLQRSKTPAPSKNSPASDTELLEKITALERSCQEAESRYLKAKEETKDLKEIFEGKVAEMRRCIRGTSEPMPLFGENGQGKEEQKQAIAEVRPADDGWREHLISALKLPPGVVGKLADANLRTLGDLVDFTDPTKNGGYNRSITDVAGIGVGAAEKIEAATAAFWASYKPPAAPEAAPVVIEKDLEKLLADESEADKEEVQKESEPAGGKES